MSSPASRQPQDGRVSLSRGVGNPSFLSNGQSWWTHLWLPLLIFVAAIALIECQNLDWRLAHSLYAWQGDAWPLRKAFLTETLIHKRGHDLSIVAWLVVLVIWLSSFKRASLYDWRKPLGYLLLSVLLATLLISWIKSWSNIDCPWDTVGLGGDRTYIRVFETRPAGLPQGRCFPGGHASGGYAWMALYFFFLMIRPHLRWRGLTVGIGVGLVFGIAQQFRGAHFISHDLWTAMLCWMVAFGLYQMFRSDTRRITTTLTSEANTHQHCDRVPNARDATGAIPEYISIPEK
jgi:membrane-associated PAP2 superfamily phosphatase